MSKNSQIDCPYKTGQLLYTPPDGVCPKGTIVLVLGVRRNSDYNLDFLIVYDFMVRGVDEWATFWDEIEVLV